MSLPSCNEPGMSDFEKQYCRNTKSQMKGIENGPVHHSATFLSCAALYNELSGPQRLSITFDEAEKDGNFQRTHCAPYMRDFFVDRAYHDHTGKWLTGYVDYGMYNGLKKLPKKTVEHHVEPLMHTIHHKIYKPEKSLSGDTHLSLFGYTFGPAVTWIVNYCWWGHCNLVFS